MRLGRLILFLAPILLIACSADQGRAQAGHNQTASPPGTAPMTIGVSTLFGQGWSARYWPLLESLPVPVVREGISWRLVESVPGQFVFDAKNSGHIDRICQMKRTVVLVLLPRHPAYDANATVYTPAGRAAFAAYVDALASHFGPCLAAVEIGNEINGAGNMIGPAATDRARYHVDLLNDVYARVKPRHPDLVLLGGSTNAIGTGFLDSLFAIGGLAQMDGVAVHPYRPDATNVDWELGRLFAAMQRAGGMKQVWATEFGSDESDASLTPAYFAQMVTLMSAAGVSHADWFALVDEPRFPHFGLYAADGSPKPVAAAFSYFARDILPRSRAEALSGGAGGLFHYRFGPDMQIVWGTSRSFQTSGNLVFRDLAGNIMAQPEGVSLTPFLAEGPGQIIFAPPTLLADSLYDYGRAPWSYFGHRGMDADRSLAPTDWLFTSFIGDPALKPATINQQGLLPSGLGKRAVTLTIRYSPEISGTLYASACLVNRVAGSTGGQFQLLHDGALLYGGAVGDTPITVTHPMTVGQGDQIDFRFTPPNDKTKAGMIQYRLRISRSAADTATC